MKAAFAGQYRRVFLLVAALLTPPMSIGQSIPILCCDGVQLYADHEPVAPGDTVTYTTEYITDNTDWRTQPFPFTFRVAIPPGLHFLSASDGGVMVNGGVEWSFEAVDPLEHGQRGLTLLVDPGAAIGSAFTVAVLIPEDPSTTGNSWMRFVSHVQPKPPLELTLDGPNLLHDFTVGAGYTLTVKNTGAQLRVYPVHATQICWADSFDPLQRSLRIDRISPSPLSASPTAVPLTIEGTGFTADTRAVFRSAGQRIEMPPENIEYLGPTALRITVRLPPALSLWTLHLLRPGPFDPATVDEVAQFVFTVANPMQLVEPLILKPWQAFAFSLRGRAGYPVTVQSSPDFTNWRDLTNMTPQGESVFIIDSGGTAANQHFYRAVRNDK